MKLPYVPNHMQEFIELVWKVKERKPNIDWELFVVTAWSLWNHRNAVKHGGQSKNATRITKEVTEYMKEIRQDTHNPGKSSRVSNLQWSPRRGWYKINTDSVVFKESGCCGIGVVIRNEESCMMGAMSKQIKLPLKALEKLWLCKRVLCLLGI